MPLDGERVAVMVIRAWLDDGAGVSPLRVRVTIAPNVFDSSRGTEARVFAEIEAICAEVRRFLEEVQSGPAAESEG